MPKRQARQAMFLIQVMKHENMFNKRAQMCPVLADRLTSNPRPKGSAGKDSSRAGLCTQLGESHGLCSRGCLQGAHPIPTCSHMSARHNKSKTIGTSWLWQARSWQVPSAKFPQRNCQVEHQNQAGGHWQSEPSHALVLSAEHSCQEEVSSNDSQMLSKQCLRLSIMGHSPGVSLRTDCCPG